MTQLCANCGEGTRWYPNTVSSLDSLLRTVIWAGTGVPHSYEIRRNICYNLQYLEYLTETLKQLNLSNVLLTQTYKSFVVTGVGIFEAIFYYIIRHKNLHRQNEWELVKEVKTQPFKVGTDTLRIDNQLLKRREAPAEEEMTFETILRKVEQHKLLGATTKFYARLHHLRKLRNKVHIHVVAEDFDTDWHSFHYKDFQLMKALLLEVFTGPVFAPGTEEKKLFTFLKPS